MNLCHASFRMTRMVWPVLGFSMYAYCTRFHVRPLDHESPTRQKPKSLPFTWLQPPRVFEYFLSVLISSSYLLSASSSGHELDTRVPRAFTQNDCCTREPCSRLSGPDQRHGSLTLISLRGSGILTLPHNQSMPNEGVCERRRAGFLQ